MAFIVFTFLHSCSSISFLKVLTLDKISRYFLDPPLRPFSRLSPCLEAGSVEAQERKQVLRAYAEHGVSVTISSVAKD